MNIRGKLTLRFLSIVSMIFITASFAIYGFSADYRRDSFYSRLLSKANNTAKLLTEVDEINTALLKKIEKDNPSSLPKEKITIYNHANEVLFTTDEDSELITATEFLGRVRDEGEVRYKQGEYENAGFLYSKGDEKFVVIAGAVDIFGIRRLQNLRRNLLLVNGASFILVFISGWLFSGQALSPIKKVINQVDEISISKLNLRVDEGNGTDEIARLAKTFNRMLERLEQSFKIQKNFIANASHELRTPLTAISGQLEVNLMKERTPEEYQEALQSVLYDMNNLVSISNRLLLLAQTDTEGGDKNFTRIRVDELLWLTQSDLKKRNPEYRMHINISDTLADDALLTVSGNEQLLKVAFANLADNACKYSSDHLVWVNLENGNSKTIVVKFIDKGIGIEPEDLEQIFEPFHRGKNALSYKGHGIGLSLVDRIIRFHNGAVRAESSEENGTVFRVSFPTIA